MELETDRVIIKPASPALTLYTQAEIYSTERVVDFFLTGVGIHTSWDPLRFNCTQVRRELSEVFELLTGLRPTQGYI